MRSIYKHDDGRLIELKQMFNSTIAQFYLLDQNKKRVKKGFDYNLIVCDLKKIKEI